MLTPTDWINLVTAVATAAAVVWAVFVYRRSIQDREEAQPRLLSPVGPVRVRRYQALQGVPNVTINDGVEIIRDSVGTLVVAQDADAVTVRLVSRSGETFSDVTYSVVSGDGTEVPVPREELVVLPNEDVMVHWLVPVGVLPEGAVDVRVRFTDAAGLRWERTSRRPLRRLKRRR